MGKDVLLTFTAVLVVSRALNLTNNFHCRVRASAAGYYIVMRNFVKWKSGSLARLASSQHPVFKLALTRPKAQAGFPRRYLVLAYVRTIVWCLNESIIMLGLY